MDIKVGNKIIWSLFIIAIVGLLLLQSIWSYNLYQSEKQDLYKQIQNILDISIENEVVHRYNQYENRLKNEMSLTNNNSKEATNDSIEVNEEEVLEAGVFQTILDRRNYKFNIDTLDSIFYNELQKADIDVTYNICYRDSNRIIIEQRGDSLLLNKKNVFHSDSMLIIDGQRVQVIADIGVPAVIKRMIWLLIGTVIGFMVIGLLIYILLKDSLNQRKINQLKNDFIHTMIHDMKSPLTIIKNTVFFLKEKQFSDEEKDKYAKIINTSIDNILEFVDKTLVLAKMESKTFSLSKIDVNIPQFITEIKEAYSVKRNKDVYITVSFNLEEDWFYADPTQLKRAVGNLLENAIKYSGNPVHIDIECVTVDSQLHISVKDDGFGISPQNLHHIFDKFERGAAVGRKDGATGFGLGLSFVKEVAQAHGGDVRVFSEENRGSSFILILPETEEAPL
ncbi:MAG: HAMP domain-containing histidine kinase [Tannerella sp.]|jgi:two-component system phosphate regulon sensor histidine kinase PhoR|nr:HAMP domain-containing histidine kinase [Tannerella sp.]